MYENLFSKKNSNYVERIIYISLIKLYVFFLLSYDFCVNDWIINKVQCSNLSHVTYVMLEDEKNCIGRRLLFGPWAAVIIILEKCWTRLCSSSTQVNNRGNIIFFLKCWIKKIIIISNSGFILANIKHLIS